MHLRSVYFLTHVIRFPNRLQGQSHRIQAERNLKYYPTSVALAGGGQNFYGPIGKANYMVSVIRSLTHLIGLVPLSDVDAMAHIPNDFVVRLSPDPIEKPLYTVERE
jgi:hypothetical protein